MTRTKFATFFAVVLLTSLLYYAFSFRTEKTDAFSVFQGAAGGFLAVPVTVVADIPFSIKEQVEDVVVRAGARRLQSELQKRVWAKIQRSGRDSLPGATGAAFVRDWREFLQGGQYRGEDVFRAILADATVGQNATVCGYLRNPLSKVFGATSIIDKFIPSKYRVNSLQYFKIENRCTLPANFDVEAFKKDFNRGGWEAFLKLTEPQNNIFGLYANSVSELEKQRGFEEGADKEEAAAGSGFTSRRTNCQGRGPSLRCVVLGDIQTPGEILQQTVQRSIDEDFSWITSADEFSELLANIAGNLLGNMLDKLDNLAKGIPGQVTGQVFDINTCINECTLSGYRTCEGKEELELAACRADVQTTCSAICSKTNIDLGL